MEAGAMAVRVNGNTTTLRVAWFYDLNACRSPTGGTRHALGQPDRPALRPEVAVRGAAGGPPEPEGVAFGEPLPPPRRRDLPLSIRAALRFWRVAGGPPVEWWSGKVDWIYCPAEFQVP